MLRVSLANIGYENAPGGALAEAAASPVPSALELERWLQLEPAQEPALSFLEAIEAAETSDDPYGLYNDLLLRCATASVQLRSSTGKALPQVSGQLLEKSYWDDSDAALSVLATEAKISPVTGCWSIPDAYRNAKGYAYTWNATKYGIEPRGKGEYKGMQIHQIAYLLRMYVEIPGYKVERGMTLEHECRFTGCCNPTHLSEVSRTENNRLQRLAKPLEVALMTGQLLMSPTGYDEIDLLAARASSEDTGIIVSTPYGPHRVIKIDQDPLIIRGEPEFDPLREVVRKPAGLPKQPSGEDLTLAFGGQKPLPKPKRKSRAKQPAVLAGQTNLLEC